MERLNLTHNMLVDYLLSDYQKGGRMQISTPQGTIEIKPTPRQLKCDKCENPYEFINKIGFVCLPCKKVPTRFQILVSEKAKPGQRKGRLTFIYTNKRQQVLSSFELAQDLLGEIQYEVEHGTFDPTKYRKKEQKEFWISSLLDEFEMGKVGEKQKRNLSLTVTLRSPIAPSYESSYRWYIKLHREFFGNKDVRDIRKKGLFEYVEWLKTVEKKKAAGSPDFRAEEFANGLTIERLCKALGKDKLNINGHAIHDLNNLLKENDLFKKMIHSNPDKALSNELNKRITAYKNEKSDRNLKRVNRSAIEMYYPQDTPIMKPGVLHSSTIGKIYSNFEAFLNWLKDQKEVIAQLPNFLTDKDLGDLLNPLAMAEPTRKKVWFDSAEQKQALDTVEDEDDALITSFLMDHPMRPGECRALQVNKVDTRRMSLDISQTFSKNILIQRRKGRNSKPYEAPIHRAWFDFFLKKTQECHPDAFIFVNSRTGKPYSQQAFTAIWEKVRAKLNLPDYIRAYDATRRSIACQQRNNGVPLDRIAKQLGHSSTKMVEEVYADLDLETMRADLAKLSVRSEKIVNLDDKRPKKKAQNE